MAKAKAKKEEVVETPEDEEGKVVIRPDLEKYDTVKSASGKKSKIRKDDPVAEALVGFSLEQVQTVADNCGVEIPDYSHLNPGMQRMCIGNKIRGWVAKETKANEALVADGKKSGPDPLDQFHKVCKPIRVQVEKAEKEAAKAKTKAA